MELNDLETETIKFIDESFYLEYDNQTKYYYTKYSEYVKSAYEYINSIYHQGDIYKIEYEKELTSLINTVVDDTNYTDKIRGIVDKYFIYKRHTPIFHNGVCLLIPFCNISEHH